jgi:hypothetical protein
MYREAADMGLSLPQFLNRQYPTIEGQAPAFEQLLASEGMFVRPVKEYGVRPATMNEILNGRPQAGTTTKEAVPASRILFPAALLSVIEDKLVPDMSQAAATFDTLIAVEDSINSDRYERPVLNFSRPEGARSQSISQLAMPASMLLITASDISRKIGVQSLGLEISEQALKTTTFDIVGLSLARQALVERNERANARILALLNGDLDSGDVALSSISGKVKNARTDFDTSIASAGVLSQKAWILWLAANATKRKISHVVTDLAGAMAIENRTGRPTVQTDNPTSARIDTIGRVLNPSWEPEVKIFLSTDPNWPAGTIMGVDQRYGIHRVNSLTASYEATEALVMRRATQMRFDSGDIVYRLFDDAFEVLTLV